MKWAFSDESRRGNRYCVVAVVVATHAVNDARKTIDGFRKPRQRRVHMTKESGSRRRQFLALLDDLPLEVIAVSVALSGRQMNEARSIALARLTGELLEAGVESWRLEWIVPHQEERDRSTIAAALGAAGQPDGILYDHFEPHADGMLWAADAYAWAVLAGAAPQVELIELP